VIVYVVDLINHRVVWCILIASSTAFFITMSFNTLNNYVTRQTTRRATAQAAAGPSSTSSAHKGKTPIRDRDEDDFFVVSSSKAAVTPSRASCNNDSLKWRQFMRSKPPSSVYAARTFDIAWDRLRHDGKPLAGIVGYTVRPKRGFRPEDTQSVIWRYGADIEQLHENKRQRYWVCEKCHLERQYHTGTYIVSGYNSIKNHLSTVHKLCFDENKQQVDSSKSQIRGGYATSRTTVTRMPFDTDAFQRAVLDWSIKQDLTYRQVTSQDTRDLLTFDRPELNSALWESHTTLSAHIKQAYEDRFQDIGSILRSAKSRIHISCDVWTSTNGLSLLGIVAHFLDKDNNKKTVLIGLPRLRSRHSGENIAKCLCEVVCRYSVQDRLGVFVMDNAGNNDTMMDHLSLQIPSVGKDYRGFCAGHNYNRIVKAILYGKGLSQFEKKLAGASDPETFQLWRQLGAIGKAHNIVKYILRSDQRRQAFAKACYIARDGGDAEGIINDALLQDEELFERLFASCEDVDAEIGLIKDGGGK
jgi:hypothetical protein